MSLFKFLGVTFILLFHQGVSNFVLSQNSENGSWLPVRGELRMLVVFAEVTGDPNYDKVNNVNWQPGKLPLYPHKYLDSLHTVTPSGYLTDYFHQASFGAFKLVGSYYPQLVQVDYKDASYSGFAKVAQKINGLSSGENTPPHFDYQSFDRWTPTGHCLPKLEKPDSLFDCVIVIWRVNSKLSPTSNSGYCSPGNQRIPLLGLKGVNCSSEFVSHGNDAEVIMRHELSHALYGGNNFHTGGAGAGQRTFIPSVTGWSNLSSWDNCMPGWNAWDRNRLGWKHPEKKYLTSAYKLVDKKWSEHPFELQTKAKPTGRFLIRNFNTSGDAVCLQLPGPDSPRLQQYLWLEYHADTGRFDISDTQRIGVYAFVQVGKDDKANPNGSVFSPGNYTFPLPASGRWDFDYGLDSSARVVLIKSNDLANPISGNHLLMRPMLDANNDGVLNDPLVLPEILIDDSHQPVQRHFGFGNPDDAFKSITQTRINVSTNPSTNSLITYSFPHTRNSKFDSDTSFITGFDLHIKDTIVIFNSFESKCAVVDVVWNRYTISNSVRWCGAIALKPSGNKPKLTVDSGCVLLLDRSLTPMQDKVNTRDTLNGQLFFSPLTTLTLYPKTQLVVKKGATLRLANGSKLFVRKGANLVFEEGATLEAVNGSVVYLE